MYLFSIYLCNLSFYLKSSIQGLHASAWIAVSWFASTRIGWQLPYPWWPGRYWRRLLRLLTYDTKRKGLFASLHANISLHATVDALLFREGSVRSRKRTFFVLLEFVRDTELYNRLWNLISADFSDVSYHSYSTFRSFMYFILPFFSASLPFLSQFPPNHIATHQIVKLTQSLRAQQHTWRVPVCLRRLPSFMVLYIFFPHY